MSDIRQTKLFVATTNEGKIIEIQHALDDLPIEITTLKDVTGTGVCPEDKATVLENAIFKAMHYSRFSDALTLADDTGLEVDALGGSPGVHSARYAGPSATYDENNRKLLEQLADVPVEERAARFVCVMAIAYRGRLLKSFQGVCEGRLLASRRGSGGFGYDPLFFIPALNKTFAELSSEEKNKISHRGKALLRVHDYFQYQIESSQG